MSFISFLSLNVVFPFAPICVMSYECNFQVLPLLLLCSPARLQSLSLSILSFSLAFLHWSSSV